MYELARRYGLFHKRSRDSEFEKANGGIWCRMGKRSDYSKGHGYGTASELPVSNDHLFCHFGETFSCGRVWLISLTVANSYLISAQTLAPAINFEVIEKSILPMMDKLVSDDIPNIRFNVAKSYAILIDVLKRLPDEGTILSLEKSGQVARPSAKGEDLVLHQILPNLEKLQQDDDVDVRYFAATAAGTVSEVMQISP